MSSVDRGSESEYELHFLCVLGSSMRKQHPRIRRLLTTEWGNRVISPLCQRAEEAIVCNSERHEEQSRTCTVENNRNLLHIAYGSSLNPPEKQGLNGCLSTAK